MLENVNGFDWDEGNSTKCWDRIPQEDIEYLFLHGEVNVAPDMKHSQDEERFIAWGVSSTGKYMFVAFTLRCRDTEVLIRPVSARYMRDKEVAKYGQKVS